MYANMSAPVNCQIEITSECPLKCQHCYNFWRQDDSCPVQSLTEEDGRIIVRKLKNAGVFNLVITGGEPLSNFNTLMACLYEAKNLDMRYSLNTNLLPLTVARAKLLRDVGISNVLTSVPGHNAETYDSITQRRGAFNHFVEKVKIAQDAGIRVSASMVVSKKNLLYIKETARFVQSLGIQSFMATKAGCPGNCSDFSEYALSMEEFRKYLKDLHEIGIELGIKVDELEGYPLCGVRDLDIYDFTLSRKCSAGVSSAAVSSTGLVRPCPHLDVSYGNIFIEDFAIIWKRMEGWRNGDFLPETCKSCKLLGLCGSGCRMEGKTCHGEMSSPDKYCVPEDIEKAHASLKKRSTKKVTEQVTSLTKFAVIPFRSRKEAFGLTVVTNGKTVALLNHEGVKIFTQFRDGLVYSVNDPRILWGSIDSLKFVLGLLGRGLVKLTQ